MCTRFQVCMSEKPCQVGSSLNCRIIKNKQIKIDYHHACIYRDETFACGLICLRQEKNVCNCWKCKWSCFFYLVTIAETEL